MTTHVLLPPMTLAPKALSSTSKAAAANATVAPDLASFEALYREHSPRVYALCARLSGDRMKADQLTQDVFVRAWERLASFRGESSFATWLRHVTVNVVLDDHRANARRARLLAFTDDDAVLDGRAVSRTDDAELDLERAIARLPAGARTVLVLHDIEGYRHDEIAMLAGIAEGTSRAHLHRARQLLKEALR